MKIKTASLARASAGRLCTERLAIFCFSSSTTPQLVISFVYMEKIVHDLPEDDDPDWSPEQLEEWARTLTKDTRLQLDWDRYQVALWAKKVLGFPAKYATLLRAQGFSAEALSFIESVDELVEIGIPKGFAITLMNKLNSISNAPRVWKKITREDFIQTLLSQAHKRRESPEPITAFIKSKVGATFPFVGREELLNSLRNDIREDYQEYLQLREDMRNNSDEKYGQKFISFKFCYGAPGIGKTRSVYELKQSVLTDNPLPQIKKWHTIFIPFSNGFGIVDYDGLWSPDTMFALRLLKSEVLEIKSLNTYCLQLLQDGAHPFIKLPLAIELISKIYNLDNECGILLVIDEINECFGNSSIPSDYVKKLLLALAELKSLDLPYIMPVFSGTSYIGFTDQVKASSFKLQEHPLGLLSGANVLAMAEQIQQSGLIPPFHESAAFTQMLRDCGGLPRFVQIVCEQAVKYHQSQESEESTMSDWDWSLIQASCIKAIQGAYHRIPKEALVDCLLGTEIDRLSKVGDSTTTWGQLEMSGAIVIVNQVPIIPYLGMLNFIQQTSKHYLKELSIWPMLCTKPDTERCFTWQDWERFNMEFAVMKLNLLAVRFAGQDIPLDMFLPKNAKCQPSVTNLVQSLSIVIWKQKFIESQHQLGKNTKLINIANGKEIDFPRPGQSIKNGVGAPADGILVLEYVHGSEKKPLLLFYSMKWTEATTLLKNEAPLELETITEEVAKMQSHYKYLTAEKLYIICTGKPCQVKNDDLPEDTIVISKETFASYFGPTFKTRAVFASVSPRRNPNTMNPQELPGIGPVSAKKIIEHRKKTPFKNADEFLRFTPTKYSQTIRKHLKFDDEK